MTQQKEAHPDSDIHPVATGQAKQTVDAHKDPKPLKLYAGWFCPFVQRAWMVLEEKQIPYEYIEVNPYHKPESLLKLNPRGLVPTLEYHGKPLYESTVICEFLQDAYPNLGPDILSQDIYERAQCQPGKTGDNDEALQSAREEFLGFIKQFTKEMHKTGPYFIGEQPLLVDFIIAPWALRLWVFDHYKGGLGIPDEGKGGEDEQIWARWRKYVKAIEERKSVKDTTSETEYFLPIYQRYADDKAQSELAKATRTGRGVP